MAPHVAPSIVEVGVPLCSSTKFSGFRSATQIFGVLYCNERIKVFR